MEKENILYLEQSVSKTVEFPFVYQPEKMMLPTDLLPENIAIGIPKSDKKDMAAGLVQWGQRYRFDFESVKKERTLMTVADSRKAFLLRSSDIVQFIQSGDLDFGILGADKIFESQLSGALIEPIQPIGFGKCMFCIGFPIGRRELPRDFDSLVVALRNTTIATSLPKVLEYLLVETGIGVPQIISMDGSVEIAPSVQRDKIGAIADIDSTGETALACGIRADYRLIEFPGAFVVQKKRLNSLERTGRILKSVAREMWDIWSSLPAPTR